MSLISLQCPNCGAPVKITDESKTHKCEFCGTEFTTQDVINHYQISNNYNTVQYVTKNISANSLLEAEEYVKNGDIFISLNEYDKAKDAYTKAIELNPADCLSWFGLVKVATKNFTDYKDTTHYNYYAKAKKVASPNQAETIESQYLPYQKKRDQLETEQRLERERIANEKQLQLKKKKRKKTICLLITCCACLICFIGCIVSIATNNLSFLIICTEIMVFICILVCIFGIFRAIYLYYINKNKKN